MAKITSKPITDDTPCTINGKHFGTPYGEVPAEYLDWCSRQEWFARKYPEAATYVKNNRKYIDLELKDKKYAVNNDEQDYEDNDSDILDNWFDNRFDPF